MRIKKKKGYKITDFETGDTVFAFNVRGTEISIIQVNPDYEVQVINHPKIVQATAVLAVLSLIPSISDKGLESEDILGQFNLIMSGLGSMASLPQTTEELITLLNKNTSLINQEVGSK